MEQSLKDEEVKSKNLADRNSALNLEIRVKDEQLTKMNQTSRDKLELENSLLGISQLVGDFEQQDEVDLAVGNDTFATPKAVKFAE